MFHKRPVFAVLAVVRRGDQLLLARRANPPDQGLWGFPGGKLEWGETIFDAAARELAEETGVVARFHHILECFDAITRDAAGVATHHFVLAAVLGDWASGEGVAGDDAAAVGWFGYDAMADLPQSARLSSLAAMALGRTNADGPYKAR